MMCSVLIWGVLAAGATCLVILSILIVQPSASILNFYQPDFSISHPITHSLYATRHRGGWIYPTTRMPYSSVCLSSSVCPRHKKSGSHLLLLYFSNLVKWISPKLQTVFLTTQLRYFLKKNDAGAENAENLWKRLFLRKMLKSHISVLPDKRTGSRMFQFLKWHSTNINLLECPIPAPPRHKKYGSLLFLLYFSNMVKWISPNLLTVFLTTWLRYFLKIVKFLGGSSWSVRWVGLGEWVGWVGSGGLCWSVDFPCF